MVAQSPYEGMSPEVVHYRKTHAFPRGSVATESFTPNAAEQQPAPSSDETAPED